MYFNYSKKDYIIQLGSDKYDKSFISKKFWSNNKEVDDYFNNVENLVEGKVLRLKK